MMRPRKIITRVIVFLLVGAIINVAVAWGCAVWAPCRGERAQRMDNQAPWLITEYGLSQSGEHGAMRVDNPGLTLTSVFVSRDVFALTQVGWPCRSLEGAILMKNASPTSVPEITHGIELPDGMRRRDPEFPTWPYIIPLRPAWPGFAINTVFYAAALGAMFLGPGMVRRALRRCRGLCPACGYPVGQSPVCTECGAALRVIAIAAS